MKRLIATFAALSFVVAPAAPAAAKLGGGGCHNDGPAEEVRATRIRIEHACFDPTVARVPLGSKVTWVNDSGLAHNITGPAIEYADLPPGSTYSMSFNNQGIYVYACLLHPGMSGAIVVRDEGEPGAADGAAATAGDQALPAAPVAATESADGGPTAAGWALAGALALVATALVAFVTRTSRTRGVPHPAR